ncbi:30S ribosomal protein S6e [Caldivirga maquilingensis]|uniref:Small ribosomal subunit protein eS6 n=1 Tax=Caldivirga maquilingensis (strain ATCC 700844 / DSM 13496 / JCM 10307 / IC-167) TaxID=397948 RepID=RS6E_CALMQ|nr:30S ribosomal protein S6e [Caldivirga maquilingensis]A8MA52.1 RecName: Full=Small ribosomal subunit protein eS6; AltName: Full=30S ribosomal protein S6e [Caldivirga maquilingensis IC-167]ABW00984.1 Ribosomal protein S6e [Caldivirga maquilingensis IC-167]
MPTFKLVLSDPRSGKSKQLEVKDEVAQRLIGLRIGDVFDAQLIKEIIDLPQGFRIKITGGTGYDGAPMHPGIEGPVKKYALLSGRPGFRPEKKGLRVRRLIRGNTISDQIVQVNAVLVYPENWDKEPVIQVSGEAKPTEAKAEEKAEAAQ